jgi:hypothetical protein
VLEEVPAFLFRVESRDVADGFAQGVDGPGADASEVGLE